VQNGWTDLNDLYVYNVFPLEDVTFGRVVDSTAHPQKNLHYRGVNTGFQAKLADCGVDGCLPFAGGSLLPNAGEILSAGGSIMLGTHYR